MSQNKLKALCAKAALYYILPKLHGSTILGIGTGSTTNLFIELMAQKKIRLKGAVASSIATKKLLEKHEIKVFKLDEVDSLELYIDGADESNSNLELVKGGGGALTQEKIVAAASKEFEQLLNSQLSKTKIEEGKVIEGKINKITEKFVFLFIEGLKSEPVLDINELKSMGWNDKIKIGEKIPVLLERIEDKNGEVLVSASKAQKIKGWDKLVEAYEKKEPIMGKITSKCKGGCIVEHIERGELMF